MSGKPIDEAVDLQALGGAAEYLADRYGKHDGWVRAIRAAIKALTAAQQQGQAVEGCPHCGGTGGHWEGCRAPVDTAPPPSVPVGVEGWTAAHALLARFVDELNVRGTMMTIDYDKLRALDSEARKVITSASTLAQQPAAVDGNWRQKAAEWLESKAVEQEANNQRWPDHAAAYKEWRDRPGVLRYLAAQVLATQHQEPKS